MEKRYLLKIKRVVLCAAFLYFLMNMIATAKAQESYQLKYNFQKGQNLQYQTERYDSTEADMGGQTNINQMTMWSLQTLSIDNVKKDVSFTISIKTDSTWTDQDESSGETGGMRERRFRMMRGPREQSYEITPAGKAVSKDPPVSSFLIPLPENAVAVNETWDFEITTEQKGRRQGKTTITGQCLLYDVQKEDNRTLAVIIVNTDSKGEGQFQFQREGGDAISGTFASTGVSTSLVYFDIDKGYIIEVVSEETRESVTESTMFSSKMSSKSKSTVRLISD